jgi:hypothetical protein
MIPLGSPIFFRSAAQRLRNGDPEWKAGSWLEKCPLAGWSAYPRPEDAPKHFQAGLLARLLPSSSPSHAYLPHSDVLTKSSGLQQRGLRRNALVMRLYPDFTGFPFHPDSKDSNRGTRKVECYTPK